MVERNLRSSRTIQFNTYDLNIGLKDIMAALATRKKAPKEMAVGELVRQLGNSQKRTKEHNEMMIELLEKFSIPLAVFLMGIIGVPLGAQLRARGRSAGIGVSLLVFLMYYMCLAGMKSICENGTIPPTIGIWIPDVFLLVSCIYLLRRVAYERSINPLEGLLSKTKGI